MSVALPQQPGLIGPDGNPVELPPDQITPAFLAGKVGFAKGAQIPVVDAHGNASTIAPEDAQTAFSRGYSYEPFESQLERAKQREYGEGLGNEAKAGLAGIARGATLGLSDAAMTESGLVEPETLKELKERNQIASTVGQVAGAVAPVLLTGGAAAPEEAAAGLSSVIPSAAASSIGKYATEKVAASIGSDGAKSLAAKIVASAVPKAAGSALEGAIYGLGNAVSEKYLGDPDMTAEKVAAQVGYGALIGGGIGALFGIGAGALDYKGFGATSASERAIAAKAASSHLAEDGMSAAHEAGPLGEPAPAAPPPTSFDEMAARNKDAPYMGISPEIPGKKSLIEATEAEPDWQFPVTRAHVTSMEDPTTYDRLRLIREGDNDLSKTLRDYESNMKAEGVQKMNSVVGGVAKDYKPTPNATDAGERLLGSFEKGYKSEKAELGSAFKQFKQVAKDTPVEWPALMVNLQKQIPDISEYVVQKGDGFVMRPYDATMSLGRESYNHVKDIVKAANANKLTIEGIWNLRDKISPNWLENPAEAAQLSGLKRNLMDLMQEHAGNVAPDLPVREVFKRYAVNEGNRETLEKVTGGSISDKASVLKQVKPEYVMDRIFNNTATVKAAKQVLSPEDFNKALADHLSEQIANNTKNGQFSSATFSNYLRKNIDTLREAFIDNPKALARLNAINTIIRTVPDATSINPSGSAKTVLGLIGMMKKLGSAVVHPGEAFGEILHAGAKGLENQRVIQDFNTLLEGAKVNEDLVSRAQNISILKKLEDFSTKTSGQIGAAAKAFIKGSAGAEVPASVNILEDSNFSGQKWQRKPADKKEAFKKRLDEVTRYASNPQALSDKLTASMAPIQRAAPNISNGLINTAIKGTQFLFDKAPKNPSAQWALSPVGKKWTPSDQDVAKWERYVAAVDKPMSVVHDLKNGTITQEGVEAMKAVHPNLYKEVVSKLTEAVSSTKEDVPYQKRIHLSMLFGQPLDPSITPEFIGAMQGNVAQTNAALEAHNNSGSVPLGRASKLQKAQSVQTDTQRVLTRGA